MCSGLVDLDPTAQNPGDERARDPGEIQFSYHVVVEGAPNIPGAQHYGPDYNGIVRV